MFCQVVHWKPNVIFHFGGFYDTAKNNVGLNQQVTNKKSLVGQFIADL